MSPVRAAAEAKASRYDRTRLENQERSVHIDHIILLLSTDNKSRAYIAASRRTDRGLNARMQSARRASEIHQKRTGKSLRVTESEVLNEALYEEITNVSTHRRRWRAHLHTQSEDFDRSLLTFMTGQLATHDALDQAVAGTWLEEQRDAAAGFVSSDIMQAIASPHPMIDMSANNFQHTPYPFGSWSPASEDCTYQASMGPPNDYAFDQQSMSPPDLTWLDTSRRMSLPTNLAPQILYSAIWAYAPANTCPTSPLLRADSDIDHVYTPNSTNNFPQTASNYQSHKPSISSPSPSPTLLSGNQHPHGHNPYNLGLEANSLPTTSPKHNFTDRRYSYNPNGKPRSTPSSSIPSPSVPYTPSVPHTPRKPLSFDIQTPASYTYTSPQ
jgi:hypothetical protein